MEREFFVQAVYTSESKTQDEQKAGWSQLQGFENTWKIITAAEYRHQEIIDEQNRKYRGPMKKGTKECSIFYARVKKK